MKQHMEKRAVMFNFKDWFKTKTDKQQIEEYLADSISLEDLERRQRLISRGEAPWQVRANQNLKGWV
jgi:hypothetical protein